MSRFSELIHKAHKALPPIIDLLNSKEIGERLTQAGGAVSLLGIAIEVVREFREKSKSRGERAYSFLLETVLESANESLKECGIEISGGYDKSKVGELFKPFEGETDWNAHLPDNPVVKGFLSIMEMHLKSDQVEDKKIQEFKKKFLRNLEHRENKDSNIKEFYDWWNEQRESAELDKYLENAKTKADNVKLPGKTSSVALHQYYIELQGIWSDFNTWDNPDAKFDKDPRDDATTIIESELLNQDNDIRWYIVIGASAGIGKTSLLKIIAYRYADHKLRDPLVPEMSNFIPILVSLRGSNDLAKVKVYNWDDLDYVLDQIISPEQNQAAKRKKILLLLDGLDEYAGKPEALMDTLREYRKKYANMKVIISTGLKADLVDLLRIKEDDGHDKYIRLLPFTEQQAKEFFKNYISELTYDYALKLGFHEAELTKPQFAWMLSSIFTPGSEIHIEFKESWSDSMRKSLIYLLFFYYKENPSQKKILRQIAALRQIYKGKLILKDTLKELEKLNSTISQAEIDQIISTYFYIQTTSDGKIINFADETISDYLLAEYYIECLLLDKAYRLNIGTPSPKALGFLNGLLDILMSEDYELQKFIEQGQTSLLKSFGYNGGHDNAKDSISSIALKAVNEDYATYISTGTQKIMTNEEIWIKLEITDNDYKHLWLHRWISLFILKRLDPEAKIKKEKLATLIAFSSSLIPHSLLRLQRVDLSSVDLYGVNLSRANLSYADLSDANLENANFERANLSYADLSDANLRNANFERAILSHSIISFMNPNSSWVASIREKLRKLSRLMEGFEEYAPGSIIDRNIQPDMAYANFTAADLSFSFISGLNSENYQNIQCGEADFTGAILEDIDLANYLYKNNAKNLSGAISDTTELVTKLKEIKANKKDPKGFMKSYVEQRYNKGRALATEEKYEEAIKNYEITIEIDPNHIDAWYNKGWALYKQEKYEEAIKYYDKALELNPNYADALNNKALALFKLAKYEEAIICYDRTIEIRPNDIDVWKNKIDALEKLGRIQDAIRCCDNVLNIHPDNAYLWSKKGRILFDQKEYGDAIKCFDKSRSIAPEDWWNWFPKGSSLILLGENADAVKVFDEILKTTPDLADIWNLKALALYEQKKYNDCLTSCEKAIDINPNHIDAWNNKGNALYKQEKYEEAIKCYDKVIEIEPNNVDARSNKGVCLRLLAKYEEAIKCYDKVIEIEPNNVDARSNKFYDLYGLGRYEEAMAIFDKALEIDPNNAGLWYNRACSQVLKGDAENGLVHLKKAIEIDKRYIEFAKEDKDFESIRNDERFKALVMK